MNFSAWSIKNPIPGILLFIMLGLAGLMCFHWMKIQQFPDIELPMVTVTAALPGAAPPQLETEVARKIENSIATLQGLKNQYTNIQDGVVVITAEFQLEKPLQEAVDDVRNAVSQVRSDLPADLRDPIVSKINLSGSPILTYTIQSPRMDEETLSWFVDYDIARAMLKVKGVGAVSRVGGVTRQVEVELDPEKLLALNATATDITRQLRLIQQEASGGQTKIGGSEQSIRTIATVKTAAEIGTMDIALSDGRHIRLDQVATVRDGIAERRSAALLNGHPVIGFEITRSKGASEVEVETGVKVALDQLKKAHPDIKITEAFNFVNPVVDNYKGSMSLLYEGAILAILVVWLFLRDWRATIIAATALPLSILPALIGMYYLGFTLNTVTLLAMSLVVGILVDDAIVEIENIIRHLRMGKTPYEAAMEAADEIGLAVIATTFTLIAVFLPTAFMSGIAGKFFVQFGWTASLAIFASLLVARLLTPMMSAYILKPWIGKIETPQVQENQIQHPNDHGDLELAHDRAKDGRVMRAYMRMVTWCLNHRWITLGSAILFFVGSIMLIPLLPTGFVPPPDTGQTQVRVELPPGSQFPDSLKAAEYARNLIKDHPEIKSVYTTIGGGSSGTDPFAGGASSEPRKATLTIQVTDRSDRSVSLQKIENDIRQRLAPLPGARIQVGIAGNNSQYQIALSGDDPDVLISTARQVEREIRTIPNIGSITSSAALIRPELVIRPDFAKAADLGITTQNIAETVRIATAGDFDQNLAKLNLSQRQIPIVIKLPLSARQDQDLIKRLMITGSKGPVMLGTIAQVNIESGPSQIDRFNRLRNINFNIELNDQPLGDVANAVDQLPTIKNLPPSVKRTNLGDADVMQQLFESFGLAMLTGVLCIYVVLVLLFKDFLQPITILVALPLSLGGAFVLLLLAKSSFSMPSLIGLIMLMGIASKNSILLVDYAIIARSERQYSRINALLDACHKRARPIIMTTLAMGAGMLPIALGIGTDPSFRAPMAISVIGGLITSTFLSLLVIPVVYTFIDDIHNILFRRNKTTKPSEAPLSQ
ncbi:efflux RND transporter permease subunit [Acinetobacter bereziniae]|uniref:Efflux RND transporter permease subunit n=2 Tax=Acinetobacter TaxID=469 RepID=A0A8I1DFA6_ACIBZ|nr:efflux RND transporter permease subunit [Acinetobacter bereziniae]MEC8123135.1 efflux RND transporter permease subunit [Pseudomonadota bacterium]MBJ9950635.1 efflux RND transporter permease subunit [Acinetobacter bereziniae]MCU4538382.1 efflux RND transporter permease subunit [Acinetobacter bereziniae]QQC83060.1 efflux RND transporter permease subunit [Acinetobacter bereziniae]UUN96215.1 efflux RND transporter permease subunit [Acinetobacter bereziniae]